MTRGMNGTSTRSRTLDPFRTFKAHEVKVGHITVDGIVLEVEHGLEATDEVVIRHRNVIYVQEPLSTVQVFGRVNPQVVAAIQQALAEQQA